MKLFNTKKRFILTIGIYSCCAFPVFADNTASTTVTVGGDVITPLSIAVNETIRFGEVAVDPSTSGTMAIDVDDHDTGAFTVSYTGNGSSDVSADASGTGTITSTHNRVAIGPGKVTVTGEPNYHYVATRPNNGFAIMTPSQGVSMKIATFSGSRTLTAAGNDSFYLGGIFTVPPLSTVGAYAGVIDITVTYD